ncbi:subtilisin-like protease SBT3.8 [Lolium perenne]|uniref:subtilisin-like protease SBT3.8 n=1 Tax=Lolium perenne TaxID=4522 RepID=UPI0021F5546D|nr:subtilisin-like protease SBT3.8 [Lolium perenne]
MGLGTGLCCALLLVTMLALSANASSKLYIVYMGDKKHDDPSVVTASHHDLLSVVHGSKEEALKSLVYSYKHGFSGFAAMLTEPQARAIAKFPEVITVKRNTFHKRHTTRSWDFLGLDYNQPPQQPGLLQKAKYGEDVIIGVIDSGIWPESRSFNDDGFGPVPARWKGKCQTGEMFNTTSCNRKIIGARWYGRGISAESFKSDYKSPRDIDGHGTHVASTIAGVEVRGVSYGGLGNGVARGGAPRARLGIYKVCWVDDCPEAAILAAIDDAIHDGVDVLSISLGWAGHEAPGTLHAVQRGISVVFSGGNDGPVPQTMSNAVPWITTVAASTIDRAFPTIISLGNKEKLVGQSRHYNASVISSHFKGLVDAGSCDAETLASSNVTGKIILCYAPADASFWPPPIALPYAINLTVTAGAKGLIFAQYTANNLDSLEACEGIMPCVLVDFEIAQRILSYLNMAENPVVKVSPTVTIIGDGVLSPRVASFSSRGPSPTFPGILKPDVAAPGVSMLAAKRDSYVFMSGTSMACPHVSAVTALLKSVHPGWSPAMIKSAIVTTASVTDRFGMPIQADAVPRKLADPFDFGGGHINPDRAVDPGLVYDVDVKEYNKFFNCTIIGLLDGCESYQLNLNLPSIDVPNLKNQVTVWRTITNVGPAEATYRADLEAPSGVVVSVEPSTINFIAGGNRSITFRLTFTTKQRVQGGYTFGSLTWSDQNAHSVRIPIAVRTVIQDFVADTS